MALQSNSLSRRFFDIFVEKKNFDEGLVTADSLTTVIHSLIVIWSKLLIVVVIADIGC